MALRVMVIGGYGNFGSIICRHLAGAPGIELVVSGRHPHKLRGKVYALKTSSGRECESWCGDAMAVGFAGVLQSMHIQLVIHTGGPFQGQSYAVAQHCIDARVNYCDLSDCRAFVNGIGVLDAKARQAGVAVLSGCSSVPTLSSALIDQYRYRFTRIDTIEHGISSSAKMPGLSTIEGVLAYAGKPIKQLKQGQVHDVLGWQDLTLRRMLIAASRTGNPQVIAHVARMVVRFDTWITTPAGVIQIITGLLLIRLAGLPVTTEWVLTALIIFLCVGSLWLPVLVLQKRLHRMASRAVQTETALDDGYRGVYRQWFWLGVFGFLGMFVIVMIMVTKMTPWQLLGLLVRA